MKKLDNKQISDMAKDIAWDSNHPNCCGIEDAIEAALHDALGEDSLPGSCADGWHRINEQNVCVYCKAHSMGNESPIDGRLPWQERRRGVA